MFSFCKDKSELKLTRELQHEMGQHSSKKEKHNVRIKHNKPNVFVFVVKVKQERSTQMHETPADKSLKERQIPEIPK